MTAPTTPDRIWAAPDYTDHERGTWGFGDWFDYKPVGQDFVAYCREDAPTYTAADLRRAKREAWEAGRDAASKVALGRWRAWAGDAGATVPVADQWVSMAGATAFQRREG
jgi:hypothetical protein